MLMLSFSMELDVLGILFYLKYSNIQDSNEAEQTHRVDLQVSPLQHHSGALPHGN